MAHFRGTVQGNRGEASRLGNKFSGLTVTANGWRMGITVELSHEDGRDVAYVYKTGGSIGKSPKTLMAKVVEGEENVTA